MKYLICLDLDGTALNDNGEISELLIDIIKQYKQKGHVIAFNTTRNYNRVKKYAEILNPDYINCLSGNYVADNKGNVFFNNFISKDIVSEVNKIIDNYKDINLICSELTHSEMVLSKEYALEHNKIYATKEVINNSPSYKLIYLFENEPTNDLLNALNNLHINYNISKKHKYIRIMPKKDKWDGIKLIIENLPLKKVKVISFGNDMSDLNTLINSDIGVAMKNADDNLKTQISNISEFDNNHNGVANYLKKISLGECFEWIFLSMETMR